MGSIRTSTQDIFENDGGYYAEAAYTVTYDHKNGTFTVTVTGVRGYVKNNTPWNFGQHITLWLGPNSDGSNRIEKKFKISASGSDSYKGYIPSSGYHTVSECSMTFDYNTDGTVPNVYIYLQSYNSGVKDLSDGVTRTLSVNSGVKNISGNITRRDLTKPDFTINQDKIELTKIGVSTTPRNNFTFDSWKVQLCEDNDANKVGPTTYNSATLSKEYNVINPTQVVWIRGRNSYNNVWSDWKKTVFDCVPPTISESKLVATSKDKATLSFKSNYKVYYKVYCTNPKMDTGWLGPVNSNTSPNESITIVQNSNSNYILQVKRYDNQNLYSSARVPCNSTVPILTISNLTVSGSNVSFDVTSDVECKEWAVKFSNAKNAHNPLDIPDSENNNNDPIKIQESTKKIHVDVKGISINVNYNITVTAKNSANNLQGTVTEYGVISKGVVNIGNDLATVYVYNGKKWVSALPLVYYDKNTSNLTALEGYSSGWYIAGSTKDKI